MPFYKPQRWALERGLVAPEWRSFWRDLVIAAPMWEGGGDPYDYAGRRFGSRTAVTWGVGPYGPKLTFGGGSNNRVEWARDGDLADLTGDLSILLIWKRNSGSGWRSLVNTRTTTPNASFLCNANEANGVQWGYGDGSAFRLIITASGDVPAVGEWVRMVCTRVKGGVNKIFLNGVEKASGTLTQTPNSPNIPIQLGVYNTSFEDFAGDMAMPLLWKRNLSPAEAIKISADPFGPMRLWRPASANVPAAVAANTRRYSLTTLGVG